MVEKKPDLYLVREIDQVEADYHARERDRLLRLKARMDALALVLLAAVVVVGAWQKARR